MALGPAAAILTLGSTVLGGLQANAQGQERQQELNRQAQLTQIQGQQSAAARNEQLDQVIGSVRTLQAQRNLNINSPSEQAIETRDTRNSDLNIGRENFNANQTATNDRMAGSAAASAGFSQAVAGGLKGAGQFLQYGGNQGWFK